MLERVTDLAISDYKFKPTIHKNEYVEDAEVDDSAEVLDEYEGISGLNIQTRPIPLTIQETFTSIPTNQKTNHLF